MVESNAEEFIIHEICGRTVLDNGIAFRCVFESPTKQREHGRVLIRKTTSDDVSIRIEGIEERETSREKLCDISYSEIDATDLEEKEDGYRIEFGEVQVDVCYNGEISIHNDKTCIDISSKPKSGTIGGNITDGTGYTRKAVDKGVSIISGSFVTFKLDIDERFYGGGEQFTEINHRGETLDLEVSQGAGTVDKSTYQPSPCFISSDGYYLLANTYSDTTFDFGETSDQYGQVKVDDESVEYLIGFGDSVQDCVSSLYEYTPDRENVPYWTYGLWTSKNSYESEEEVLDIAEEYINRDIPCSVIHIDPAWTGNDFNFEIEWGDNFPNPKNMMSKLEMMGYKTSIWTYPHIVKDDDIFDQLNELDILIKNGFSRPALYMKNGKSTASVDFSKQDAVDWWKNKITHHLELGVDCIKCDFGETLPQNAVFDVGVSNSSIKNKYPFLFQEATKGAFEQAGKKPVLWSRSGWGPQRNGRIHWSGDPDSTWDALQTTVKAGLNASLSNILYWSCDLGGYRRTPSDKLYGEWTKWGLLGLSHVRAHGKTPREPWEFPNSFSEVKTVIHERYKLLPYFYSYGEVAANSGIPITRPMVFESEQPQFWNLHTQHMVGNDLLIAPFLSESRNTTIYFPKSSDWVCYWTDEEYTGGSTIEQEHSDVVPIPFYVRKGTLIPNDSVQVGTSLEGYNDPTLHLYGTPTKPRTTPYTNPKTEKTAELLVEMKNDNINITIPENEFTTLVVHNIERDKIVINGENHAVPDDNHINL